MQNDFNLSHLKEAKVQLLKQLGEAKSALNTSRERYEAMQKKRDSWWRSVLRILYRVY